MFSIKKIIIVILALVITTFISTPVYAIQFGLIEPEGQLQSGQEIVFTITLNTEGVSLKSTQIGMTYQTQYLQYVRVTPVDTMTSVTAEEVSSGDLVFTGTHPTGFSGEGTFAEVTFKIIAAGPGSTELCVLYAPESAPTPTQAAQPTQPKTTTAPKPTALPKTGSVAQNIGIGIIGTLLFAFSISGLLLKHKPQPIKSRHHSKS